MGCLDCILNLQNSSLDNEGVELLRALTFIGVGSAENSAVGMGLQPELVGSNSGQERDMVGVKAQEVVASVEEVASVINHEGVVALDCAAVRSSP
jgi:hypothetical protein